MDRLSDNWFIEPIFDFEYKSYQVLGYSKELDRRFENWCFYPYIEDLARHYQLLLHCTHSKSELEEKLYTAISEFDFENFKVLKEPLADPKRVISELEAILNFALQKFGADLNQAHSELNTIEKELEIRPLGLSDLTMTKGLLFFRQPNATRVYTYQTRIIRRPGKHHSYKDLKTSYVQTRSTGMFTNFREVKWDIIKAKSLDKRSNAFLIESNKELPHYELVLPLVKNYILSLNP